MPYTNIPPRAVVRGDSLRESPPRQEPDNSPGSRHSSQVRNNYDQDVMRTPTQTPNPRYPHAYTSGRNSITIPGRRLSVYRNDSERDLRASISNRPSSDHRGSADSTDTLIEGDFPAWKDSYASYRHPYDIQPPHQARGGDVPPGGVLDGRTYYSDKKEDFKDDVTDFDDDDDDDKSGDRRRGFFGNLLALQGIDGKDGDGGVVHGFHIRQTGLGWGQRTIDDLACEEDQVIDPDDPTLTGERKQSLQDVPSDIERNILRDMSYRERRKEAQRMKIQYNVTCEYCPLHYT